MPTPSRLDPRRLLRTLALSVGTALAVAGCSDSPTSNVQVSGVFQLQTIDGQPLPFSKTNPASGVTTTVVFETFTFNRNGVFTEELGVTQSTATTSKNILFTFTGTYTARGTDVSLVARSGWENGVQFPMAGSDPVVGTLAAGRLTVSIDDFLGGGATALTAVYEKQ